MKKTLFDVMRMSGNIVIFEGSTARIALTQKEAIDMIRAISSAIINEKNTYSVERDAEGRGDI